MNTTHHCDLPVLQTIIERGKAEHKDYQYDGVSWCIKQEKILGSKPKGGLLADEMGLGKTLTVMGVIMENLKRRTLIVLPVALLTQWHDQILRFTGHRALIFHGRNKHVDDDKLLYAPIVLTTYAAISFNKKKQNFGRLHKIHWNRIIFDEAHHLRNASTAKFAGAAVLHAETRWFVTGTPIQNKKRDLVSLSVLLGVTPTELIDTYMLRRTKESVGLILPPAIEHTRNVTWDTEEERDLAEEFHSHLPFSNVSSEKSSTVSLLLSETPLVAITRAKQLCTMPSLLTHHMNQLVEKEVIEPNHPRLKGATFTSKLDAVVDQIVFNQHNNNKKLVFCTYRREMDFLKQSLLDEGINTFIVDGRSKKALSNCQHADVLILQIQTCCEGLNLQSFSEIYFVTPHWNPFVEQQAVARCHRFGQEREVHIYRFFMSPYDFTRRSGSSATPVTFDNHVASVQQEKLALAQEFIYDPIQV